jgi:uncharacterized membrane protein YcgQ (UPF0703/DUF1980 family)
MKVTVITVIVASIFLFIAMSYLALSLLTNDEVQKVENMNYAVFAFIAAMTTVILTVVVVRAKKHIKRSRYRANF